LRWFRWLDPFCPPHDGQASRLLRCGFWRGHNRHLFLDRLLNRNDRRFLRRGCFLDRLGFLDRQRFLDRRRERLRFARGPGGLRRRRFRDRVTP
jgi:hypothetical protein